MEGRAEGVRRCIEEAWEAVGAEPRSDGFCRPAGACFKEEHAELDVWSMTEASSLDIPLRSVLLTNVLNNLAGPCAEGADLSEDKSDRDALLALATAQELARYPARVGGRSDYEPEPVQLALALAVVAGPAAGRRLKGRAYSYESPSGPTPGFGLVSAAPGSGKTAVALLAACRLLAEDVWEEASSTFSRWGASAPNDDPLAPRVGYGDKHKRLGDRKAGSSSRLARAAVLVATENAHAQWVQAASGTAREAGVEFLVDNEFVAHVRACAKSADAAGRPVLAVVNTAAMCRYFESCFEVGVLFLCVDEIAHQAKRMPTARSWGAKPMPSIYRALGLTASVSRMVRDPELRARGKGNWLRGMVLAASKEEPSQSSVFDRDTWRRVAVATVATPLQLRMSAFRVATEVRLVNVSTPLTLAHALLKSYNEVIEVKTSAKFRVLHNRLHAAGVHIVQRVGLTRAMQLLVSRAFRDELEFDLPEDTPNLWVPPEEEAEEPVSLRVVFAGLLACMHSGAPAGWRAAARGAEGEAYDLERTARAWCARRVSAFDEAENEEAVESLLSRDEGCRDGLVSYAGSIRMMSHLIRARYECERCISACSVCAEEISLQNGRACPRCCLFLCGSCAHAPGRCASDAENQKCLTAAAAVEAALSKAAGRRTVLFAEERVFGYEPAPGLNCFDLSRLEEWRAAPAASSPVLLVIGGEDAVALTGINLETAEAVVCAGRPRDEEQAYSRALRKNSAVPQLLIVRVLTGTCPRGRPRVSGSPGSQPALARLPVQPGEDAGFVPACLAAAFPSTNWEREDDLHVPPSRLRVTIFPSGAARRLLSVELRLPACFSVEGSNGAFGTEPVVAFHFAPDSLTSDPCVPGDAAALRLINDADGGVRAGGWSARRAAPLSRTAAAARGFARSSTTRFWRWRRDGPARTPSPSRARGSPSTRRRRRRP